MSKTCIMESLNGTWYYSQFDRAELLNQDLVEGIDFKEVKDNRPDYPEYDQQIRYNKTIPYYNHYNIRGDDKSPLFPSLPGDSPNHMESEHMDTKNYNDLTESDIEEICKQFDYAQHMRTDPLHGAACAANSAFRLTDRQHNGKAGGNAFAFALAILIMRKKIAIVEIIQ